MKTWWGGGRSGWTPHQDGEDGGSPPLPSTGLWGFCGGGLQFWELIPRVIPRMNLNFHSKCLYPGDILISLTSPQGEYLKKQHVEMNTEFVSHYQQF